MVRTPILTTLTVMALLFASGAAAAQPLAASGATSMEAHEEMNVEDHATVDGQAGADTSYDTEVEISEDLDDVAPSQTPCPPEQMCTPAEPGTEELADMDGDLAAKAEAALDVDLNLEGEQDDDAEPLPPVDEDEQDEQDEQTSEEQTDAEANASSVTGAHGDAHLDTESEVSAEIGGGAGEEIQTPAEPAPEEDEQEQETPRDDRADENHTPIAVDGEYDYEAQVRELSSYLDVREQERLQLDLRVEEDEEQATEPTPESEPIETPLDHEGEAGFDLDLKGTFEASTKPVSNAYLSVRDSVDRAVGQLKGAFNGGASAEAAVDSATDIETAEQITGNADVASEATGVVETDVVDEIELPEVAPPAANLESTSSAQSHTSLSSSAAGDLGFDI